MSDFSCSFQESSWESRSYHDPTRLQIVWIGLPLCINSFPRKLPNEYWPICCPESISRKANTVENNILWIVDCSSTSKNKLLIKCSRKCSDSLLNRIRLTRNVCILDSFSPVTHQKSAQHYWAELNENWLEEMKWLVGRDEIKVYWRIPFCESVVTFFKCYKNKEFF